MLGPENLDEVEEACRLYRAVYHDRGIYENHMYPDIQNVLRRLSHRSRLFIATNKLMDFARLIPKHFGIDTFFDGIYGRRPDEEDKTTMIAYMIEKHGLEPDRTVMVGDRKHDILAAHANHIKAVGVTTGTACARNWRKRAPNGSATARINCRPCWVDPGPL